MLGSPRAEAFGFCVVSTSARYCLERLDRLRNDLLCVERDVKLLTQSLTQIFLT